MFFHLHLLTLIPQGEHLFPRGPPAHTYRTFFIFISQRHRVASPKDTPDGMVEDLGERKRLREMEWWWWWWWCGGGDCGVGVDLRIFLQRRRIEGREAAEACWCGSVGSACSWVKRGMLRRGRRRGAHLSARFCEGRVHGPPTGKQYVGEQGDSWADDNHSYFLGVEIITVIPLGMSRHSSAHRFILVQVN